MAAYLAGYAWANDVSLPESSLYRPVIKAKCRDGFCPLGDIAQLAASDKLDIITEINGVEHDRWWTADLVRLVPYLYATASWLLASASDRSLFQLLGIIMASVDSFSA